MPKEKTIYSEQQYRKDVQKIEAAENGKIPLDLRAFKRLMVSDLCAKTDILSDFKVGLYGLDKIQQALNHPELYGHILVETSKHLMGISSFYMRINKYFATMGLFNYCVDTYDVKSMDKNVVKRYQDDCSKLYAQLEKMNLKHEFSKIMLSLPSEDIYCGLIFENNTDFFIYKLPLSMCKLAQIQDGVFNFKINLSMINPINIGCYPTYLQQAFLDYNNHKYYTDGWYMPDPKNQICIKMNENVYYPFPFLIMLVQDIFDIDTYKKLKLQKARVDNYKAIVVEIPIDKNSVDKPLLTEDTISIFAEMNKANMPDDVGLLHTLGEAEPISFKDNTNNTNNLSDAIGNLYDAAGTPSQIFNGATASSALKMAVENDASVVYRVYRQFERYMNRFIKLQKFNKPNYKFAFRIHDSTVFNRDTVTDGFLKAAEHGLPFKMDYAVSLGLSQGRIIGNMFAENIAFKIHENLFPLPTSYTQPADEVGKPTNESKGIELDDSGEKTADSEANKNR